MHLTVVCAENESWTMKEMDRDGIKCYEPLWMTGIIMLKQ